MKLPDLHHFFDNEKWDLPKKKALVELTEKYDHNVKNRWRRIDSELAMNFADYVSNEKATQQKHQQMLTKNEIKDGKMVEKRIGFACRMCNKVLPGKHIII